MSVTYVPRALRARIADAAKERCGYCHATTAIVGTPMEIEHLIPESMGGLTEEDNLWLACSMCNDHKSNRIAALDEVSGVVVRLFDPRRQVWREHFQWSEAGDQILGITPAGRATVAALDLNRPSAVKARQLWKSVGWHPPSDDLT